MSGFNPIKSDICQCTIEYVVPPQWISTENSDYFSFFFLQIKRGHYGVQRTELLPGDRDNLAIQTRGGPEKHEVTGWVLVSTKSWQDFTVKVRQQGVAP